MKNKDQLIKALEKELETNDHYARLTEKDKDPTVHAYYEAKASAFGEAVMIVENRK